jgi:hypothetical protein
LVDLGAAWDCLRFLATFAPKRRFDLILGPSGVIFYGTQHRLTVCPNRVTDKDYFIPSHVPSFIRRPPRDNGIPVSFDTRRFALVTPSARFHENDKPGPSFTAPPVSPPNLPHLVHTYI